MMIFCVTLEPVSYTHLDVYKRQGLVMMYNRGNPWFAFGLTMPYASEANFERVDSLKSWHETLANLGYFVIGLHAAAALAHHYFWKDNTLLRMMPRKRS